MNRVDLVARASAMSGATQREANTVILAAFTAIADALAKGEEVSVHGFGTFRPRERRPRTIRHPQTKEKIVVSPGRTVVFSPAAPLRRRLAGDEGR